MRNLSPPLHYTRYKTESSTSLVQQGADPRGSRPGGGHVQDARGDVLGHAVRRVEAVVHGGGDDPHGAGLHPATAIKTWADGNGIYQTKTSFIWEGSHLLHKEE